VIVNVCMPDATHYTFTTVSLPVRRFPITTPGHCRAVEEEGDQEVPEEFWKKNVDADVQVQLDHGGGNTRLNWRETSGL